MQSLQIRLEELKGTSFMYNTKNYKFLNFELRNGSVIIGTDKKIMTFDRKQFEEEIIKEFLMVCDDETADNKMVLTLVPDKKEMLDLKSVIMENINKVREDPKYIAQAQSVNKSINTLLHLVNTEVRAMKGLK